MDEFEVPPEILKLHKKMNDVQRPVIYDLAVTKGWGFGRIIQICHELWDEQLSNEWNIRNHYRDFSLASAMVLIEQEAKAHPEKADHLMELHDGLADVLRNKNAS